MESLVNRAIHSADRLNAKKKEREKKKKMYLQNAHIFSINFYLPARLFIYALQNTFLFCSPSIYLSTGSVCCLFFRCASFHTLALGPCRRQNRGKDLSRLSKRWCVLHAPISWLTKLMEPTWGPVGRLGWGRGGPLVAVDGWNTHIEEADGSRATHRPR